MTPHPVDLSRAVWRKSTYSAGNGGQCVEAAVSGAVWRKSTYSGSNGGQCVEAGVSGAVWRKSTYSSSNGGQCVEVARNLPAVVAVRDSKTPDGPKLIVAAHAWGAFLTAVREGQLGR